MTRDEMKALIQGLSENERHTLRHLTTYGIDEWDEKTTINGKSFICPDCGGTGLLEVVDRVVETWASILFWSQVSRRMLASEVSTRS